MSKIEWTEKTWNPITGCSKISTGCANCYALRMAKRLKAMGKPQYQNVINGTGRWTGTIEFVGSALEKPLRWKKPRMIFVNSMSDLFHEDVSIEWQTDIFEMMARTPRHTYQILTKRAELLVPGIFNIGTGVAYRLGKQREPGFWPLQNVWLGVSVETSDYTSRIDYLRRTEAAIKFLSLEPLLGPLPQLDLSGIDWVIVGGETGPGARPMHPNWARDIRDQCLQVGVPFFFKSWGAWSPHNPGTVNGNAPRYGGFLAEDGHFVEKIKIRDCQVGKAYSAISRVGKKQAGNLLDGREWKEMPGGGHCEQR